MSIVPIHDNSYVKDDVKYGSDFYWNTKFLNSYINEKVYEILKTATNSEVIKDNIKVLFTITSSTLLVKYIKQSSYKSALKWVLMAFLSSWSLYTFNRFILFYKGYNKKELSKIKNKKDRLTFSVKNWLDTEFGTHIYDNQFQDLVNKIIQEDNFNIFIDMPNITKNFYPSLENYVKNISKHSYQTSFLRYFIKYPTYVNYMLFVYPIILVAVLRVIFTNLPWYFSKLDSKLGETIKVIVDNVIKLLLRS